MALTEQQKQQYNEYVEQVTPKHNIWMVTFRAFLVGGLICLFAQWLGNVIKGYGIEEKQADTWVTIILILISMITTGFGWYAKLAKFGGAGTLVPITGFANSVVASAIEFKSEGQVFGIGCKIFTIAGPVILYGLCSSSLLGLIYWIMKIF